MASSGSFNTSAYGSGDYYRYLRFEWKVKSQSIANNTTTIEWTLKGAGGSTNSWVVSGNFQVVIDGVVVFSSATRINLYNGTVVASGTRTLSHNNLGNKSFSASAQAGIYTVAVNCSGSGSWALPQIPRYATSSQSLSAKTETSITMNWSSDSTVDYIWYSKDDGANWTGLDVADGKSGSYTISGLTANTTYKIKTRVRRKDSQLTTDSSALSVATYAYPYANSMPNFTIGDKLTLGIYNPLGRSVTVNILGADDSQISNDTTTGTSITGYAGDVVVNRLYASIPNAKSGTYKVKVTYGSQISTKTGGTYTVNPADCSPTIGSGSYRDSNATTTAITGDSSKIIQKHSTVSYTAAGLTAQKGATVASCSVAVNGNSYGLTLNAEGTSATGGNAVIDSAYDVTATFTVVDSRGLTATKEITVNMLEWSLPTAIIEAKRQNNFYSETDITVDADYSYLDGNNTIDIKYRYKKVTDTAWSDYATLQDNVTGTFVADNDYAWDIQVVVTDRLGGSTAYNLQISRGMPIIFYDRIKSSTGFNCFPVGEKTVEINGVDIMALATRNAMTRSLSAQITNLTENAYTKIPLDLSASTGSKLTATNDGGIKIGAGVTKVMVSGKMAVENVKTGGNRHLRIMKNSYTNNNTLGWAKVTIEVSDSEDVIIPPVLVNVQENDVIYLWYHTPDGDDKITGNAYGSRTELTVEVVA